MSDEKRLSELREQIDSVDLQIADFLNRRAGMVAEIGDIKRRLDLPIYDEQREREIVTKLSICNDGPLSNEILAAIYLDILRHMKTFE